MPQSTVEAVSLKPGGKPAPPAPPALPPLSVPPAAGFSPAAPAMELLLGFLEGVDVSSPHATGYSDEHQTPEGYRLGKRR